MARKIKTDEQETTFDPYVSSPHGMTEIIDTSTELVNPSPLMPSAVQRDGEASVMVAAMPKFRVVRQALVMNRGSRVLLRPGKLIDGANYDIEALVRQGVELERLGL
jgi:hypothetical protein